MIYKGVQIKFKREFGEGLEKLIDHLIVQMKPETDDDRLLLASLAEIRHRLHQKLEYIGRNYTMTLTAAQSIALRILYTDYVNDHKTYMGIKLLEIANEVQQKFAA
jgi:hypothetical protein